MLVDLHPRWAQVQTDVDRVVRQRTALLKQCGGRLGDEERATLDVWDAKLVDSGEALAKGRLDLLASLMTPVATAYRRLAGRTATVRLDYVASWSIEAGGLRPALAESRAADVRRGMCTVGPHRDDVAIWLDDLPSRTHASQGEQRSLALALRLASHELVTQAIGEGPVLLLDDVFSELDPQRSAALLSVLPVGQAVLTTAGAVPAGVHPAARLRIKDGAVLAS
jgi:DNA replication and repair protein RecF